MGEIGVIYPITPQGKIGVIIGYIYIFRYIPQIYPVTFTTKYYNRELPHFTPINI